MPDTDSDTLVQWPLAPRPVIVSGQIKAYYGHIRDATVPRSLWIIACRSRKPPWFPNLICQSFCPCRLPYPGEAVSSLLNGKAFASYAQARPSRDPHNPKPCGYVTGPQSSLHATVRAIARPASVGTFTTELSRSRLPASRVSYNYVRVPSPRWDPHPLATQPYGLQAQSHIIAFLAPPARRSPRNRQFPQLQSFGKPLPSHRHLRQGVENNGRS